MVDPMHFDARAEIYERARPPYPEALWRRLCAVGLLAPGVRIVEFGAGSGQATAPLVEAGAEVTAVEPGPALAARLRARLPSVRVLVETAEAVALSDAAFDAAVVATAVHWLDLDVVLPKLHRALVPGGRFAVWRTVFGDPTARTAFRDQVERIVARREDPPRRSGPGELDTAAWARRLSVGDLFTEEFTELYRWSVDFSSDQVRDLFLTFSEWSAAEADAAAKAVDELGGQVTEHYLSWLILMKRADSSPA
ncbi:class I SAM-dependent methyltransferase [Microbacterium sp. B2969]|uniref:Class I SAM-dependent methyltransferase n=1 Tax=Microbacterium alkaliflavum TaxID=3248839 RepID=A0ABW7QEN9_9MICO